MRFVLFDSVLAKDAAFGKWSRRQGRAGHFLCFNFTFLLLDAV